MPAVLVVAQHGSRAIQLRRSPAQAPHIASSPIGCANGAPQAAHHGGAKNVIPRQHRPHRASGSPIVSPHARQRGGNTPSTTALPIRRKRLEAQLARVAAACIDTHHQVASASVNPDLQVSPRWPDPTTSH
jgi:hypothetical protein